MATSSEEPSAWELKRGIDGLREDVRTGFDGLGKRLDAAVGKDVFEEYRLRQSDAMQALREDVEDLKRNEVAYVTKHAADIKALETVRDADKQAASEQREDDKRLLIGAAIFPTVLVLAAYLMQHVH